MNQLKTNFLRIRTTSQADPTQILANKIILHNKQQIRQKTRFHGNRSNLSQVSIDYVPSASPFLISQNSMLKQKVSQCHNRSAEVVRFRSNYKLEPILAVKIEQDVQARYDGEDDLQEQVDFENFLFGDQEQEESVSGEKFDKFEFIYQ